MPRRHPLEIMPWEREAMNELRPNIPRFDVVERSIQEIPLDQIRGETGLQIWLDTVDKYLTGGDVSKKEYIDEVTKIFNLFNRENN